MEQLRSDPLAILTEAEIVPDDWQRRVLTTSSTRTLLLCSRQAGKSTVSAALSLRAALLEPSSLVLLLAPSRQQSSELLLKVASLYRTLGRPVPTVRPRDSSLKIELANGSRIIALPGTERTIRGFSSTRLVVVDEAARVPDPLYQAIRPFLAVSGGSLVALSSAYAKLGWFYSEYTAGSSAWERVRIPADQVPRISADFLEEERQSLGERVFLREYFCEFSEADDAAFREADIQAALTDELQPLFEGA